MKGTSKIILNNLYIRYKLILIINRKIVYEMVHD